MDRHRGPLCVTRSLQSATQLHFQRATGWERIPVAIDLIPVRTLHLQRGLLVKAERPSAIGQPYRVSGAG